MAPNNAPHIPPFLSILGRTLGAMKGGGQCVSQYMVPPGTWEAKGWAVQADKGAGDGWKFDRVGIDFPLSDLHYYFGFFPDIFSLKSRSLWYFKGVGEAHSDANDVSQGKLYYHLWPPPSATAQSLAVQDISPTGKIPHSRFRIGSNRAYCRWI